MRVLAGNNPLCIVSCTDLHVLLNEGQHCHAGCLKQLVGDVALVAAAKPGVCLQEGHYDKQGQVVLWLGSITVLLVRNCCWCRCGLRQLLPFCCCWVPQCKQRPDLWLDASGCCSGQRSTRMGTPAVVVLLLISSERSSCPNSRTPSHFRSPSFRSVV